MDLTQVLALLLAYVPAEYAVYILALCGVCAVAAALWKRPADDSKLLPLYQIVNALGCNFLAARNHSAAASAAMSFQTPANLPTLVAVSGGAGGPAAAPTPAGVPVALVGDKPAPVPPKP